MIGPLTHGAEQSSNCHSKPIRRNSSISVRVRREVISTNHGTCSKFSKRLAPLSFSTTNAATFSLGQVASFPTTINGEYDNATNASRTLAFIFHAPPFAIRFLGVSLCKRRLSCWGPALPAASNCPGRSSRGHSAHMSNSCSIAIADE